MNNRELTMGGMMRQNDGDCYPEFLASINTNFDRVTEHYKGLFTTNTMDLFEVFLNHLPGEERQRYTCSACRRFVEAYGGIVYVLEDGEMVSAIWNEKITPDFFKPAVAAMKATVLKSQITGVFIPGSQTLGQSVTNDWHHMSVRVPLKIVYVSKLDTAGQKMAEKREDYRILSAGLQEYPLEAVNQAISLLKTDSLYRSEKCLGVAEWLRDLHIRLTKAKTHNRRNLIWAAVAAAPVGYCHVRSSMIGTLLDDIVAGLPFDSISRRFAEKMHPLQYQRPQALPSEGNVKEAERIVEKLGLRPAFKRRYARLEELNTMWKPRKHEVTEQGAGLFSHLITKKKKVVADITIPPVVMTWKKFSETVLPDATKIEYQVKPGKDNYSALVTAADAAAPPILQWDDVAQRNPFSWYVYIGGSEPSRWGLSAGYRNVTGICLQPSMWYGEFPHQGKSVFFILDGAKDLHPKNSGSALFPEMMKAELRAVRSTIEAFSKSTDLEGQSEASACGIMLAGSRSWDAVIRVTTETGTAVYKLDRWD